MVLYTWARLQQITIIARGGAFVYWQAERHHCIGPYRRRTDCRRSQAEIEAAVLIVDVDIVYTAKGITTSFELTGSRTVGLLGLALMEAEGRNVVLFDPYRLWLHLSVHRQLLVIHHDCLLRILRHTQPDSLLTAFMTVQTYSLAS